MHARGAAIAAAFSFSTRLLHAAGAASAGFPDAKSYRTEKVADRVYAFISPESNTQLVSGNSLVVIGDESVLVVDSGNFPTLARKMVAEIRRLTPLPVRYLVHTHWHPDHLMGDSTFQDAFPALTIVSTDFTRERIADSAPKYVRGPIEKGPAYLEKLRERLRTRKEADGSPMTPQAAKLQEKAIADMELAISEFGQSRPLLPALTFDRTLSVHLGRREVRLSFAGRANTGGDALVYVPDAKVLATGDVIVAPTPYAFGSYPGEWIEVLRKVTSFGTVAIVPGHGPVMRDATYASLLIQLLESLRSQVAEAVRQGATLEEARGRVDLESFRKRFAGHDPDRGRAFQDGFVVPAVERAYQEAKNVFAPED
ncbi:MAG: MBL fold metallo-hydrolase [Acidobacteriota bacterium]